MFSNMAEEIRKHASFITNKKTYYVLLFAYFVFMAIPQWFRPFSPQFLVWFIALPIIVLILIVVGVRGMIGIWRSKASNTTPNPRYVAFVQISGISFLWFVVSAGLAYGAHYLYNHQRFDSEIWRNPNSAKYVSYDLTPRQRMLDDVIENVLPGSTQPEIEALLGESTNTGYFSQSERDLIYVLGAERGLGVDSEWLLIWFDDSGKFQRYEITTD
jgi:hypothetical protein